MEGRKYSRFSVQLPVSCHGDNFFERGTILNVSAEGCAITSDTVPSAGVYLHVTMQLREQRSRSRSIWPRSDGCPRRGSALNLLESALRKGNG